MASNFDPWFPMVISEKCDGCARNGKPRCVEFCPNEVFAFREGKAVVINPANCGKGSGTNHCSACAPLCHSRAIVFPSKTTVNVSETKGKTALIRKTTCIVCGKQYWTNRSENVCFDCEKMKPHGKS